MAFPYKQVHLDFHTSPDISGIGSRFDKQQFQQALKAAHLDSITVFAKCHHGFCYYPTAVGNMHPGLRFDLTGAMIDAAHEIGIRAPIYITAGWSENDAITHPEWLTRKEDGSPLVGNNMEKVLAKTADEPREDVAWYDLCLNDGTYARHIYDLTEEVCNRYAQVDGLFFDISVRCDVCYCDECLAGMASEGIDSHDHKAARRYFTAKRQTFMETCGKILHKYHPNATIFFNTGGANINLPQYHDYQTHFEMEDLPTCWHGYDRIPLRAQYFQQKGKPYLGMTGKFHLDWGEFGGYKCKEALKYEVCSMALYGAGCSIGDHLHPDGEMELQTYENIGYAYEYLEKIAPYCYSGASTARLGLLLSHSNAANNGLAKILLESQNDFCVVSNNNISEFEAVIVPEEARYDGATVDALKAYVKNGGKLLICGNALIRDGRFLLDTGCEYVSTPQFDCDYIQTNVPNDLELPQAPMLCNFPAQSVRVTDGQILAEATLPYFSRTVGRFCGHKNTPYNKSADKLPAIVRKGNVVYMAHPMASAYDTFGSLYQKRYFLFALSQIFHGGAFTAEGLGSQGRATMIRQAEKNRYCINMTYASPVTRGKARIIEDILPVYNIRFRLDISEKIRKAHLPLHGIELSVESDGRYQYVTVPNLECHETLVLEY